MSDGENSTGAITGITTFLILAFLLPGVVYLCIVLLLFGLGCIKAFFPGVEFGLDIALGSTVFLGLVITPFALLLEVSVRRLCQSAGRRGGLAFSAYAEKIFDADRKKELGWYFWQLWGQAIMHWNMAVGVLMIYIVYKMTTVDPWCCSWKDWTLALVGSNLLCWVVFDKWHRSLMSKLK